MRPSAPVSWLFLLFSIVVGLVTFGCGGGGGGGGGNQNPTNSLSVVLDPSAKGEGGIVGQSVRIRLTDPIGRVVEERRIDVSGTAPITVDFTNLPAGAYRAVLDLNENNTFSGKIVGELVLPVQVNNAVQDRVKIGGRATSLVVLPQNPSIPQGTAVSLVAVPRTADNAATFAPLDSITWSGGNGSATVSETGNVSGLAPGSTTARATLSNPALTGQSVVTITPPQAENQAALTIFVYLSTANESYALAENVINGLEKNATGNVRYVIQWKNAQLLYPNSAFNGVRRYVAQYDTSPDLRSRLVGDLGGEVDMGSPQVLSDFLTWGMSQFPSQKYGLIVWGMASGYSRGRDVSYDHEFASSLSPSELAQALGQRKLEFLVLDGNHQGLIENMFPIRNNAKYILANAGEMPAGGFRYGFGLDKINTTLNDTPQILARLANDVAVAYPEFPMRPFVINAAGIEAMAGSLSLTSDALRTNQTAGLAAYGSALSSTTIFRETTYGDLAKFGDALAASNGSQTVKDAGTRLAAATRAAVVFTPSVGPAGFGPGFETSGKLIDEYRQLNLSQFGNWDEWLTIVGSP